MGIEFSVDASDVLRWARLGDEVAMETEPAIAHALNAFGERVVETAAAAIEESTGQDGVRSLITVYRAEPGHLTWEMDASGAVPTGTTWEKEWTEATDHTFAKGSLVSIKNDHDDFCPVCEEIIAGGPYTPEEVNALSMKWAHYVPPPTVKGDRSNLIHPNCRCYPVAWQSTRRLPVSMGPRGTEGTKMMTAEQVGKAVADALRAMIKVKA